MAVTVLATTAARTCHESCSEEGIKVLRKPFGGAMAGSYASGNKLNSILIKDIVTIPDMQVPPEKDSSNADVTADINEFRILRFGSTYSGNMLPSEDREAEHGLDLDTRALCSSQPTAVTCWTASS